MATNVANRYINIKNFTAGGTVFTTIQDVTYGSDAKEITDAGDNEAYLSFVARGVYMTRVTITLKDPVQAEALKNLSGVDLTFSGVITQAGATGVNVTLSGFTGFKDDGKAVYNAPWGQSVSGLCVKSDGTNPVLIAIGSV